MFKTIEGDFKNKNIDNTLIELIKERKKHDSNNKENRIADINFVFIL